MTKTTLSTMWLGAALRPLAALPRLSVMPPNFSRSWLRVLDRLTVGVKVALQILPSVASCVRLLRVPLAQARMTEPFVALVLKPVTISLKVMVTVAVSPAVRRSLSISIVTLGAVVSVVVLAGMVFSFRQDEGIDGVPVIRRGRHHSASVSVMSLFCSAAA